MLDIAKYSLAELYYLEKTHYIALEKLKSISSFSFCKLYVYLCFCFICYSAFYYAIFVTFFFVDGNFFEQKTLFYGNSTTRTASKFRAIQPKFYQL